MFKQSITPALAALDLTENELCLTALQEQCLTDFIEEIKTGALPAFSCVNEQADLDQTQTLAAEWRQKFKHVVCLGVGGSSLGAQVLARLGGLNQNPQLHFIDNVSSSTIDKLLASLPLEETALLSVSKSGGTIDTMVPTLLFVQAFQNAGLNLKNHMAVITEPKDSPLKKIAQEFDLPTFDHDPHVGGRYSVFSVVGGLPAQLASSNMKNVRQGAAQTLEAFCANPKNNPATEWALLAMAAEKEGYDTTILMPYGDSWRLLGPWFVQLWAESLGKNGLGTLPVAAVGSTDQHSMLQLLLDGPGHKLVSLIIPPKSTPDHKISPQHAQLVGQEHLANLDASTLLKAQGQGTAEALSARGVPVRIIAPHTMNEASLGGVLMTLMLETVITAKLMGVNPFDQPAVEESKKRTMAYLQNR